ncbi:MAG: OBAP family protein [Nitrosospira sp.]
MRFVSKEEIMSGRDKYLISFRGACLVAGLGFMGAVLPLSFAQEPVPSTKPAGEIKTPSTKILEVGARFLQGTQPLKSFDIYLVGFHPMKDHPENQMEAHHYCHQTNEDFAQCMLFDGNTRDANLNGIEYIISEKLFATLPEEEKKHWHPHNGEILSGQLVAPNIPDIAEKALMKGKINSYGKTWHVWHTGYEGKPGDDLPLGEPKLGWSFNRDGEAAPGLVEKRDAEMKINSVEKRRQRMDLKQLAEPQSGVDDLKAKFGRPTTDIPGVVDQKNITSGE